jgi:hypothetical protein
MVVAEARIGRLTTRGGHLQDAASGPGAQVREGGADDMDRAEQVGVDDAPDLLVGCLLDGGKDPIAGVVYDDIDRAEASNASFTTRRTRSVSVTSSWASQSRSPCSARRSSRASGRRSVAATRSPWGQEAFGEQSPKPEEVPVMNQVVVMVFPSLCRARGYDFESA